MNIRLRMDVPRGLTQMGYAGWLYAGRTPAGGCIGVDTILVRRAITITPT